MNVSAEMPLMRDLAQRSVHTLCREGKAFLTMVNDTTCISLREFERLAGAP